MTIITIALPNNLDKQYLSLFKDSNFEEPKIFNKKLRNAFVSFNGIVLRFGLFAEYDSVYQYPERVNDFIKKGREQAFHSLIFRKVPFNFVKEKVFIIHQPWLNFYHWMLESLPRLIQLKEEWSSSKLVIPRSIYNLPYVKETLDLFPEVEFTVNSNENIFCKNFILPNLRPQCHLYNKELLLKTKIEILERIKPTKNEYFKKIFIVRKKATKRTIVNLHDVVESLEKMGFKVVDMEDFSLIQQIEIFANAEQIVTQHGAALSNLLFAKPGTKILEIHKKITNNNDHLSRVYWYLADILELNYECIFASPENPETDFFDASIIVDIELIEKQLTEWI